MFPRKIRPPVVVVCWSFVALRVLSCFFRAWHDENELRGEAKLLLRQVCDIPRHHAVGSSLIRCDEARSVLGAGPVLLVVLERALTYLVVDTLRAARREIGAFVHTVGLVASLCVGVLCILRSFMLRVSTRRWEKDQMEAASEMFRARSTTIVPLRFFDHDE